MPRRTFVDAGLCVFHRQPAARFPRRDHPVLARETAPCGIQVNVVEPNYLYSEAYYPKARFIDDPSGRAEIAARVPLGRLGNPEEVGELIAFLVSGRSPFVTGEVVGFTGGWP